MHTFVALTSTLQSSLSFAYDLEMLPRAMECDACGNPMGKISERCTLDGYRWRCGRRQCRKTKSARAGTLFENSNLTVKQALTSCTLGAKKILKPMLELMQK